MARMVSRYSLSQRTADEGPPASRLSMNSATSSAPNVSGPTGLRSIVAQTFWRAPEFAADGQVIAENARMIDRPDGNVRHRPLQRGQGNIPVIDSQQA